MERLNKGFVFWLLVLVSIALPLSAQKTVKKQLYVASIATANGGGTGSASIVISTSNPEYRIRTFSVPNQGATRVALLRADLSWPGEIVLCENGGTAGDCAYDASGNLDIEGVLVGPMFPPGVTGGMFNTALSTGTLMIRINDGAAGSGVFIRVI